MLSKFTLTTGDKTAIQALCLSNDQQMDVKTIVRMFVKDGRVVPMEVIDKYAERVEQRMR